MVDKNKHSHNYGINLYDIDLRIKSTFRFLKKKQSRYVINTYKRINNLLLKNNLVKICKEGTYIYKSEHEKYLQDRIFTIEERIKKKLDYDKYYDEIIFLSQDIEIFLKNNIIISDDKDLLKSRISMLYKIKTILSYVMNIDTI